MYTVEELIARRKASNVPERPNRRPPIPFVVSILERYVLPGQTVVDLGCGTGPYRGMFPATMIGIDQYQGPRDDHYGDADHVADMTALPLGDNTVDVLFSVAAFFQVSDPAKGLAEIRRVLKPGGRIVLFDYNARTQRRLAKLYGRPLPCWSQWRLRRLVGAAGFRDVEMLMPTQHEPGLIEFWIRFVDQALRCDWAIVSAIK